MLYVTVGDVGNLGFTKTTFIVLGGTKGSFYLVCPVNPGVEGEGR
jgi:hypothetical protein